MNGLASIMFGELDGRASAWAKRLLASCEQAGVAAELSASITTVLWAKLAFICAQAGMTRLARSYGMSTERHPAPNAEMCASASPT